MSKDCSTPGRPTFGTIPSGEDDCPRARLMSEAARTGISSHRARETTIKVFYRQQSYGYTFSQGLGRAHGAPAAKRADAAVRRLTPYSRSDESAGVRHAAAARLEGRVPRTDVRDGRS